MSKVFNIIQPIEFLNHNSEVKKDQMFHYNLKLTRQLLIFRRTCFITLQEHQTIPIKCDSIKKFDFGVIMVIYEKFFSIFKYLRGIKKCVLKLML